MKTLLYLLQEIPRWKLTTYRDLWKVLKLHPRTVASLLRKNQNQDIFPCYKVIHSNGTIWGYNLWKDEKISRILNDGIQINNWKIDKKYFYVFKNMNE